MKQVVKVSFYLKKNERKEDGKCPVMARLFIGTSKVSFSTKMTISLSLWGAGRAVGKSQTANEINRKLDEIRASALSHYRELSAVREHVTAEEVKTLLLGMAFGQETLLAYFQTHNEKFDKRVGVNRKQCSATSYWYALGHLTKFIKVKYKLSDIPFTALDRSFIDKYDLHLRIGCGLSSGTIVRLTTCLNTIVGYAIAEGIITADPFAGYEPERPERQQKYLTREELDRLMTTPLTLPKHYLIRDMFLFSCYTGIPYGDMRKLTDEDIYIAEDGEVWIKTAREKTGIDYEIPLLDLPLQILDRYNGTASKGRLLPMYGNATTNRELKQIAAVCGINRKLFFHCARHTYASEITLSQGVPIETVSRMLGHSQITTTQIYAKITDNKIDEDMKALEERIAGRFQFTI